MNGWQFLAGVAIGGAITLGSYLAILVPARRERTRVRETSIAAFEAVVTATEHQRCRVIPQGTVVQSWYCLTHFQAWVGEGECPGHCPCTPDPTRDRTRP